MIHLLYQKIFLRNRSAFSFLSSLDKGEGLMIPLVQLFTNYFKKGRVNVEAICVLSVSLDVGIVFFRDSFCSGDGQIRS